MARRLPVPHRGVGLARFLQQTQRQPQRFWYVCCILFPWKNGLVYHVGCKYKESHFLIVAAFEQLFLRSPKSPGEV